MQWKVRATSRKSIRVKLGLFAGCALNTYLLANLCNDRAFIDQFTSNYQVGEFQTLTGNDKDFLTTRVAYKLNLRGPVVTVQSACATSLVAICQASQSLLNYQCDMALAGGASVTFPQMRGHVHQEGGLASGDGYCRPLRCESRGYGVWAWRGSRAAEALRRCGGAMVIRSRRLFEALLSTMTARKRPAIWLQAWRDRRA